MFFDLHVFMICWLLIIKNNAKSKKRSCNYLRYILIWREITNNLKQNFVWVQKHAMNDLQKLDFFNEQKKRLMNRLKLIITIINNEKKNDKNRFLKYIDVLIEIYKWCQHDICNLIYNILEIESIFSNRARNSRKLKSMKIYELFTILKNAYLIFIDNINTRIFVNNWINLKFYNTLFDEN